MSKKNSSKKKLINVFGLGIKNCIKSLYMFGINTRTIPYKIKKKSLRLILIFLKVFNFNKKLKENIKNSINFNIRIQTYKGNRQKFKRPSRGQRTHTNGKTVKRIKLF
jgi:ribosomal protein S13